MSADYLELQTKVFMAESKLGFGPDPLSKQALRHQADYLAHREPPRSLAPSQRFQRLRWALAHR
ncbi:MAG: hypothetical protein ABI577_10735 [bacterium]